MTTRTEKKMVTIEQEIPVYIAEDGTEFETQSGCLAYEAQLKAMRKQEEEREIKDAFEKLVLLKRDADCGFVYDATVYICKLNSADDYEVVDKWLEISRCEMDYLDAPESFPCRFVFSIDSGNYATTERDDFLDWARDIIKVLDETEERK